MVHHMLGHKISFDKLQNTGMSGYNGIQLEIKKVARKSPNIFEVSNPLKKKSLDQKRNHQRNYKIL